MAFPLNGIRLPKLAIIPARELRGLRRSRTMSEDQHVQSHNVEDEKEVALQKIHQVQYEM